MKAGSPGPLKRTCKRIKRGDLTIDSNIPTLTGIARWEHELLLPLVHDALKKVSAEEPASKESAGAVALHVANESTMVRKRAERASTKSDTKHPNSYTEQIMVTEARVEANRKNASLSTGPRSPDGKAMSSKNAVRHGLLGGDLLLPDEDAAELERFRAGVLERLQPEDDVERFMADRVVANAWRLRRLYRMETEVLRRLKYNGTEVDFGVALERDLHHGDNLPKLARYESMLDRGLRRALHELERLQARRRGEHVPVPGVVDIDVSVDGNSELQPDTSAPKKGR